MIQDRILPDAQPCPNCGDPRPGNYCAACGQRRVVHVLSLRRLVADAVEDQFSLSAALPRTLKALFVHPGQLTTEYLRGRIAHYVPPFRLYLLTSFLFFLTAALFSCDEGSQAQANLQFGDEPGGVRFTRDNRAADTAAADTAAADTAATVARAPSDAVLLALSDSALEVQADSAAARERRHVLQRHRNAVTITAELDTFFMRFDIPWEAQIHERIRARAIRMNDVDDDLGDIWQREIAARGPIVIFLLVPVFTAIMKLLYVRQRRFYVEHFVFALHLHSFVFFALTLMGLLQRWQLVRTLVGLWIVIYLWLSLRRVYRQGWFITTAKYFMLGFVYMILGILALVGTFVFTFFFAPI